MGTSVSLRAVVKIRESCVARSVSSHPGVHFLDSQWRVYLRMWLPGSPSVLNSFILINNQAPGACLAAQGLRLCLLLQGAHVQSMVGELRSHMWDHFSYIKFL